MRPRALAALFAVSLALAGCKQDLYSGLSERDANEMVAVLMDANIDAARIVADNGTNVVRVPKDALPGAVRALAAAGLPRESYKTVEDVFPSGKLIQGPAEQRIRIAFALGQDLARSLSAIQGVTMARVHVALGQTDARGAVTTKPSASVIIRYAPSAQLDELPTQARAIVASGVEGLSAGDVKVILSPEGGQAPLAAGGASSAPERQALGISPRTRAGSP